MAEAMPFLSVGFFLAGSSASPSRRDLSQGLASIIVANEIRKAEDSMRAGGATPGPISTENEEEESNGIIE
jgi:hypothetical protein